MTWFWAFSRVQSLRAHCCLLEPCSCWSHERRIPQLLHAELSNSSENSCQVFSWHNIENWFNIFWILQDLFFVPFGYTAVNVGPQWHEEEKRCSGLSLIRAHCFRQAYSCTTLKINHFRGVSLTLIFNSSIFDLRHGPIFSKTALVPFWLYDFDGQLKTISATET